MTVMRESEIDEHRLAAAIQHVGRLQVEVHHVLPVKVVQRERKRGTQAGDLLGWQRSAADPIVEPDALDELHHEIWRGFDVAVGHQCRMVRTLREAHPAPCGRPRSR